MHSLSSLAVLSALERIAGRGEPPNRGVLSKERQRDSGVNGTFRHHCCIALASAFEAAQDGPVQTSQVNVRPALVKSHAYCRGASVH